MAKKTSNKEFKPKVEDKKEIAKAFPTSKMVKIILLKDGKEYERKYEYHELAYVATK